MGAGKKRCVILAGILVVAIPLVGLALFVNFTGTAALEERVVNENRNYSFIEKGSVTKDAFIAMIESVVKGQDHPRFL